MPDGRLVWITERQISRCPVDVMRAYDAAPADPVEAVLDAMRPFVDIDAVTREELLAILAALGLPSSDETTG